MTIFFIDEGNEVPRSTYRGQTSDCNMVLYY